MEYHVLRGKLSYDGRINITDREVMINSNLPKASIYLISLVRSNMYHSTLPSDTFDI